MFEKSASLRVWLIGGDGPIINTRATKRTLAGEVVLIGGAIGMADVDAIGHVDEGDMFAVLLGRKLSMPRADADPEAAFGTAYRWDPAAAEGEGALVPSAAGEAVQAYAIEAVPAGADRLTVWCPLPPCVASADTGAPLPGDGEGDDGGDGAP